MPYFGEPVGGVKIQTTSKNSQQHYTTKRLIRDLLSNTPKFYVGEGEATFDISIFKHGSEAFGSKLQIFQVSFVPQFPKET